MWFSESIFFLLGIFRLGSSWNLSEYSHSWTWPKKKDKFHKNGDVLVVVPYFKILLPFNCITALILTSVIGLASNFEHATLLNLSLTTIESKQQCEFFVENEEGNFLCPLSIIFRKKNITKTKKNIFNTWIILYGDFTWSFSIVHWISLRSHKRE